MAERDWQGDLDDDCTLRRYGMIAHVEQMRHGHWWFSIGRLPWTPGEDDLYNTANNEIVIRLTTGKMARIAAEIAMEILRRD
jgi:hypothetical protein